MKLTLGLMTAAAFALVGLETQSPPDTVESHVAAARAAAGKDFTGLADRLCTAPAPEPPAASTAPAPARRQGPPPRESWHADPVKVFDNLYFVGEQEYSAWAVVTSAGIIIIDPIFDYSVEDEVVGGLRKLGLDPAAIKYVLVSHAHYDHVGGAAFLQDSFNARVVISEPDWELLGRATGSWRKPKRDMVATDGQRLTLGDTTLTLHLTPGHTLGTISSLIPVKDAGRPHVAAYWGGTAFNWVANRAAYITPERPDSFWFGRYIDSAQRFRQLATAAGADVLLSNHTAFDGSKTKLPALATRRPADPHPYVIGPAAVGRYLTVAEECAKAGRLRAASGGGK
jgi:metallo-beta-lactamase class B